MISFKHILCPTDFSVESNNAIKYAIKMADSNHTHIHLLHILEIPYAQDPYGLNYYNQMASALKEEAKSKMNELLTSFKEKFPTYNFSTEITESTDPATVITDLAKSTSSELIVMSSHGRKGLDRLLMGSVAESVMRLCDIPVIVIKTKATKLTP